LGGRGRPQEPPPPPEACRRSGALRVSALEPAPRERI
jgi:hypothetical protein